MTSPSPFPVEPPAGESADEPPSGTILVVEDEVLVRLAIAEFLRGCGYHVFEAANADEAKAVLEATADVDIVFSDVNMPGEADGFALAAWVRERHAQVRVILTSGLSGASRRARQLCHEGPLLERPYDHETVLRRVQELLRHRGRAN